MDKNFTSIADQIALFKDKLQKRQKYIKNEFQAYGLELAEELHDWKNRSLYIRLSKNTDRKLLEEARFFVRGQLPGQVKSPGRLFMWKLRELKEPKKG